MKASILAGGLGTRLRPYTLFIPKPMLPLADKPILEHLIDWLASYEIRDIIISVSYLHKFIEDYFTQGKELGVKLSYVKSRRPMGTAGQLKPLENLMDETFVCLYADSIFRFPLDKAIAVHHKSKALGTIILREYAIPLRYGMIELDGKGFMKEWKEKPEVKGLMNTGYYIFEPGFFKYIPKDKVYGMDSAFKAALAAGEKIRGYVGRGEFMDIGDRKSYVDAYDKYLKKLGKIG